MKVIDIATALLLPPLNPSRVDIDPEHISSLADSIAAYGQRVPIEVHAEGDKYRIDAGHCRYLAALERNIGHLRAQVNEPADAATGAILQTIENMHRSNLSPMEEALQLAAMMRELNNDLSATARTLKRRPDWITQRLALLDLAPELKELVHGKKLAIGSAMALNRIENADHRAYHLHHTINGGASEPVVRAWVEQYLASQIAQPEAPPILPPQINAGEQYTVSMPCFMCGTPHDYKLLRIQRVCDQCCVAIEHSKHAPPPAIAHDTAHQN